MTFIATTKIAPFTSPTGDYRGFSVVFNHPGGHLAKVGPEIYRLRCQVRDDPGLTLYRDLLRGWQQISKDLRGLGPAPISPAALHVTEADIWHPANIGQISNVSFAAELNDFLRGLPHSLAAGWPNPIKAIETMLVEHQFVVRLAFDRLHFFGEALVALLCPADDESEKEMKLITDCRTKLDNLLGPYGKPPSRSFKGHVTLCYFPNLDTAEKAKGMLPSWQPIFQAATVGHAIEFRDASVFAFTSMLDFYTRRPGKSALHVTGGALAGDGGLKEKGYREVCNTEIAFFTERAEQDRHFHRRATEIYTVLEGGPMHILVADREFAVKQGESIMVHPGAVHMVLRGGPRFLVQVVTVNSGGDDDRFVAPLAPKELVQLFGNQTPRLVPNVTCAAFRNTSKPHALAAVIEEVVQIMSLRFGKEFQPYRSDWVHSTWIGLECLRKGGSLYNVNFATNYGEIKRPGFQEFVYELRQQLAVPVRLRYGGFHACSCTAAEKQAWECIKGSEFHSCGRSAHEGTLYASSNSPVVLTGWPANNVAGGENYPRSAYLFRRRVEDFGIVDKYHFPARHDRWFWENDDCGITLGRLGDVSPEQIASVVSEVRDLLGGRPPIYANITADDLAVIKYNDTKLERCVGIIPLKELTKDNFESLYDDIGW